MKDKGFLFQKVFLLVITFCFIWGCQTPPSGPPLSCEEQLGLGELTKEEVSGLLDSAEQGKEFETCWVPLVKDCLDTNKEIPHRHVILALNRFNQYRHEDYFQKATVRYFRHLIFDEMEYRKQDKQFLTAYVRYVLKNCSSKDCPPLKTARQICKRLDPDLFSKFFETS